MDKKNTTELLEYILTSISMIEKRSENIKSSEDFLKNDEGMEKLDAISMRLQTIGEAVKNILKTSPQIFGDDDSLYWSNIVKLREIISHHYIDIDSQIIFEICTEELEVLKTKVSELLTKI